MNSGILYSSENLKVFRNGPWSTKSQTVLICFQYKQPDQHLDRVGFAEEFCEKYQLDAVFVNCISNEWYQYADLPEALFVLRSFVAEWQGRATYGSSMGGYAALRFAAAVGAQTSIAIGPQYSPRPSVVAGENRYVDFIAHTKFLYEDSLKASSGVQNFIVYDPFLELDRRHVERYSQDAPISPIPIPCGGHTPTVVLAQAGLLPDFILKLLAGRFSASDFRRTFRANRRSSSEYMKELRLRLAARRG